MATNKYTVWNPIPEISKNLSCEGIHDDYEGFRILLKGPDESSPLLRITFDPALAYRNIDESDLRATTQALDEPGESSLYIVEGSSWIEWFQKESFSIHEESKITHYAIYTDNDCIDVLSEFAPVVEWLDD